MCTRNLTVTLSIRAHPWASGSRETERIGTSESVAWVFAFNRIHNSLSANGGPWPVTVQYRSIPFLLWRKRQFTLQLGKLARLCRVMKAALPYLELRKGDQPFPKKSRVPTLRNGQRG